MLNASFQAGFDEVLRLHGVKTSATVDALQGAYRRLKPVRITGKYHNSWFGPHVSPTTMAINTPSGGATRTLGLGGIPVENPQAQKAVNVLSGLHEGFERQSLSRGAGDATAFHGHAAPQVLLNESNMLAGLTGQGSDEARSAFQSMRNIENESGQISDAVKRLSGGRMPFTYGETKLPKAMRSRLDLLLRGMG